MIVQKIDSNKVNGGKKRTPGNKKKTGDKVVTIHDHQKVTKYPKKAKGANIKPGVNNDRKWKQI
jgi:hypothetical protein